MSKNYCTDLVRGARGLPDLPVAAPYPELAAAPSVPSARPAPLGPLVSVSGSNLDETMSFAAIEFG